MRFKTRLRVDKIPQLLRITQALERLDKQCVLHFCSADYDIVRLIVQPSADGSIAAYAQLTKDAWFEGYRIESQNGNQIGLELDIQNLTRAYLINLHRQCCATLIWEESLRSASAADEVVVKLAKKGVPVLTFEIRTHLGPIMQDVPVTVLSAVRLAECCEPEVETDVGGFTLPTLTRLHSVVERMKGLGTRLELEASIGERHAVLSIHMLTDSVSVSTTYRQLPRANMMDGTGSAAAVAQPENGPHKATMDLKNFSKSLYGHLIQPKHAICFILRHCVLVHLMGNDSMDVSYYIPRLLY